MKKYAALLLPFQRHLDHLSPLCSLYNIPLYVSSKELYKVIINQYFNINVLCEEPQKTANIITENYHSVISTLPRKFLSPYFFFDEFLLNKKINTIWIPHGSSDKRNTKHYGNYLTKDEKIFIYGKKMLLTIPEKIRDNCHVVGNFRYKYFLLYKKQYDNLLTKLYPEIFDKENILYAPSWESKEISSWIKSLIKNKPSHLNLFIKFHPSTYNNHSGNVLSEMYKSCKNVFFIKDFFPIYPLLNHMSYLYTDISSVGYDFLAFQRPIFFTVTKNTPLNKCGLSVDIKDPYAKLNFSSCNKVKASLFKESFSKVPENLF